MCLSSSLFSGRQASKIVCLRIRFCSRVNVTVTSPVAQLVSRWTCDLKVGGSRAVQDTSRINPIFAGFRCLSS